MEEMNITPAVYRNNEDGNPASIQAQIDGKKLSVPLDPANRHYAEIMRQVDAGELVVEPDPGPTEEQLAAAARSQRDALLSQSDWMTVRAMDTGNPVPTEWQTYRQALRDITGQPGFPDTINWPEKPQ
jgi:hypothetical protein